MKLTFLGTGAAEGVPGLWCTCENCQAIRKAGGRSIRRRSGMAIDDRFLIDCGPDLVMVAAQFGLDLSLIRTLLITHEHSDHLYLPNLEVRSTDFCPTPMPTLAVYGSGSVIPLVRKTEDSEARRFLRTQVVEPFQTWEADGYQITALAARHGRPPMQPLFYAIVATSGSLLYAHDTGPFPEETWDYLANPPDGQRFRFDVVTLDATMGVLERGGGTHMNLTQVAEHRDRLAELGLLAPNARVYANHFSHNGISTHDALEDRLAGTGIVPAYDGLTVET